ncbi:hypothetical protein MACH21_05100 [Roseicyclus marinus]|uniref:Uncharacterized protein n=1 Tax=Roseicyclus marinus TaxID=2161673 RepID=A0AA48H7H8_9RHOB|nr:hypothetical protein MACH21_05100 [Roseicyclus marinus]
MKARLAWAVVGALLGCFFGAGTGVVFGGGGGINGVWLFGPLGAVVGFFAATDLNGIWRKITQSNK